MLFADCNTDVMMMLMHLPWPATVAVQVEIFRSIRGSARLSSSSSSSSSSHLKLLFFTRPHSSRSPPSSIFNFSFSSFFPVSYSIFSSILNLSLVASFLFFFCQVNISLLAHPLLYLHDLNLKPLKHSKRIIQKTKKVKSTS